MRKRATTTKALLAVCCILAGLLPSSDSACAANINDAQAVKKALKDVPNAQITEIDLDYEKGELVYDIQLVKGMKKYDITYSASSGKKLSYSWEKMYVSPRYDKAPVGREKCQSLAKKKVKNASILSIAEKTDDGVDIYKVKLKAGRKQYKLEYHARTGKLIEFEWELKNSSSGNSRNGYIGIEKAKGIALAKVPGATVVKAEFDNDDGIPVYEIELVKGFYEYDFEIHAKTGKILKQEQDWND